MAQISLRKLNTSDALSSPSTANRLPRITSIHAETNSYVDLVAIHGILDSDADRAWSRGPGSLPQSWLSEPSLLPASIAHLNVWTYRYSVMPVAPKDGGLSTHLQRTGNALAKLLSALNTSSTTTPLTPKSASSSSIAGGDIVPGTWIAPGERLLILIAHGYGGLVALKSLIVSSSVRERCVGVVFLGTPFRPVSDDNNIASTLPITPTESASIEELLDELEVLPEVLAEWRAKSGSASVPIRCFYETEPTRGRDNIPRFVVPKQAAVLDDQNAMSFALDDVDHQNMNKFSGADDFNYELMLDVLQGLIVNAYPAFLIQAIRHHDIEYARQIIDLHRSSFATNEALNPALIEAVEAGELQILQLMLNASVRVNTVLDKETQETLLFFAVRATSARKVDIIRRLLEKGADVGVVNAAGKSPVKIAEEIGDTEVIKLLEDRPLILGPPIRRMSYDWIAPPHKRFNDYGCTRKISAKIVDMYDIGGEERAYLRNPSVQDLIYEHGPRHLMNRERAMEADAGIFKFRWMHVPANNLAWIKDLIQRSYRERTPDEDFDKEHYIRNYTNVSDRTHWEELVNVSPMEELLYLRYMLPRTRVLPYVGNPSSVPGANAIIFMPYLHYEYTSKRREMARTIDQVRDGMRSKPPRGNSPDQNALWAYLKRDFPLHVRRTLDQYYYDALDSDRPLKRGVPPRNEDQVSQRFMRSQPKWREDDPLLLMVDQLWIVILEDDTIITSFPQRWGLTSAHDQNPVRDGDISGMIAKELSNQEREPLDTPYDMMILIIELCTNVLFDQAVHRNEKLRFFEFFERKIQQVTNQEAETFTYLKTQLEQLSKRNRARDTDATLQRLLDELLDITAEANMLSEIKDIHDELAMMRNLFESQLKVLSDMSDLLEYPKSTIPPHVTHRWRRVMLNIEQRREKVELMDLNANRTYKSINNLFDLKSRQADVLEVHLTRKVAQDSGRQSTTIMVFTVVTIVFLPLSFMSSFFALNVQEFPRDPANQNQLYMSLSWVSSRVFGYGLGIAVLIILIGFGLNELKNRVPSRDELFTNLRNKRQGFKSTMDRSWSSTPAPGTVVEPTPPPHPGPSSPQPLFLGKHNKMSFPTWKNFLPSRKRVIAERQDGVSMFSYDSYVRREDDLNESGNTAYSTPRAMTDSKEIPSVESGAANSQSQSQQRNSPSAPSTLTSLFWRSSPTAAPIGTSPGGPGRRATRSWDVGAAYGSPVEDGNAVRKRWLFGTKTWSPEDGVRVV